MRLQLSVILTAGGRPQERMLGSARASGSLITLGARRFSRSKARAGPLEIIHFFGIMLFRITQFVAICMST